MPQIYKGMIMVDHIKCDLCQVCIGICPEEALYLNIVPRRIEVKDGCKKESLCMAICTTVCEKEALIIMEEKD